MKFQLLKLVVWPVSVEFEPRIVEFKPGVVNVITGSSRTGKSAIIPIIDYCLASSDCYIPIDTIRDHASWYGIVFETENEQILICRKVPQGNKGSNDFFISRGQIVSIPGIISNSNENQDGIKSILNTISFVPSFGLEENEDSKGYKARLGFRDLMALVFQTQDIVANQNILFYKTHAHEHRERLRNWFPYILGAEDISILIARQRLQTIEKRLSQLKKEFDKAKLISTTWMANMQGHLWVAKEYGLLDEEISKDTSPDELLSIAKNILENIPEYSQTKFDDIEKVNTEIALVEKEDERLSSMIGLAKKRLNDIKSLKSGLVEYSGAVKKRVDRLQISQWIKNVAVEGQGCPACGNANHPNSKIEIEKISLAFKKFEEESKNVAQIPTSFSREEERINHELTTLLEQKKGFQERFDFLLAGDKKAQEDFQRKKNMFFFLGHLKASTETFERLADGGDLSKEIETLEKEYSDLLAITDYTGVQKRTDAALLKISQGILNHLKTLDVENKYRQIAPRFTIKDLNIAVLSNDDHWHFLAEVGSASNWVSFHIALMCSLQEYFISQSASSVPGFVIFDQPSQVYFPKLKKTKMITEGEEKEEVVDPQYEDEEDVEAVKSMFKTISDSIISKKGAWQSIILDHADDSIYGEIEGVHEVQNWRNGNKLIPEEWYL